MKRWTLVIIVVILLSISLQAQQDYNKADHEKHLSEQFSLMTFAPAKRDDSGQLKPLQSYGQTLDRSMSFIFDSLSTWFKGDPNTLLDEIGIKRPVYFYYANLALDGLPFRGAEDNYVSYPAFHHSSFIETFTDWYIYSGNSDALLEAQDLADWNLAHSTPPEYPYGGMPYSTFNKGKPGGFVDGNSIMPDKAAVMALAYLRVSQLTGEEKYFNAAYQIADKLAANQLPEGNWPFRVDPKTKEATEGYTSSVIYQIKLFEAIGLETGKNEFEKNRVAAFKWLMENPVKTGRWSGFYEDIRYRENRTNWDCMETVRYLVKHRGENPEFLPTALKLNGYITDTVMVKDQTFINTGHPYAPAEGIREQKTCFVTMGVHSAHWAAMLADLYQATGDEECRKRAVQTMNFVTYHLQPDGKILVGADYEHEKSGWSFNQYWFSCHIMTSMFMLEFLGEFPEMAPAGEDHLLSYTSAITSIDYGPDRISYTTKGAGTDILKLSFIPKRVRVNGKVLPMDEKQNGWVFTKGTKVLKITHGSGTVAID